MSPSILQRDEDASSPYDPPIVPKSLSVQQIALGVFAGLWAFSLSAALVYAIVRAVT